MPKLGPTGETVAGSPAWYYSNCLWPTVRFVVGNTRGAHHCAGTGRGNHSSTASRPHGPASFGHGPEIGVACPQAHTGLARPALGIERLEPRQLLAAAPVIINEFLARNDAGLRDGNGRSSDWIELLNTTASPLDLAGYHLTDDRADPGKWSFPLNTVLQPGQYLILFASGQESAGYSDAAGYLHTSFTLRRGGGYLALSDPSGRVLSSFGPAGVSYVEQLANVSYGQAQSFTLLDARSQTKYWVPLEDRVDATWTNPDFDATANGFLTGTGALGFESRPGDSANFVGLFDTELPAETHAVYTRFEFDLKNAAAVTDLTLRMTYDNGYVAYLNGVKVAQDNAPAALAWFSTAAARGKSDSSIVEGPVEIPLSEHRGALRDGKNVLAIHLLNHFQDNDDLLLTAELYAGAADLERATGQPPKVGFFPLPTPGRANGGNDDVFVGFVADTQFSADRGFYSDPFPVTITTETADAVIRYTTDGSTPTATHGTVYTGPITISTTTPLRAAAFKEGFLPTNVDTQTYIFLRDVIQQGNAPRAIPTSGAWVWDRANRPTTRWTPRSRKTPPIATSWTTRCCRFPRFRSSRISRIFLIRKPASIKMPSTRACSGNGPPRWS